MLKQQVAEIHCEPHTFMREVGTYGLIDRSLCPKTDGVVAIDAQQRRADKNLVSLSLWYGHSTRDKSVRMFANQFSEQPPIPFVRWPPPSRRAVTIYEAVVEHIGTL